MLIWRTKILLESRRIRGSILRRDTKLEYLITPFALMSYKRKQMTFFKEKPCANCMKQLKLLLLDQLCRSGKEPS